MLKFNKMKIKNVVLGKLRSGPLLNPDVTNSYKYNAVIKIKFPYLFNEGVTMFRPVTIALTDIGLTGVYFLNNDILKIQWGDGGTVVTTNTHIEHTYSINDMDKVNKYSTFNVVIESDGKLLITDPLVKTAVFSNDYEFTVESLIETVINS